MESPGGRVHAEILFKRLSSELEKIQEPWNEEGYAWEFIGKRNGITIGVLVGIVDDEAWQTIVHAFSFRSWLFPRMAESAVGAIAAVVTDTLTKDDRITDLAVLTEAQEQAELKQMRESLKRGRR